MGIKERVTGLLALPKEITLNLPLIMLTGRDEVNIENYKSIVEYTDTKIRVHTTSGLLTVEGKKLRLKQITAENIVVSGEMAGIRYVE